MNDMEVFLAKLCDNEVDRSTFLKMSSLLDSPDEVSVDVINKFGELLKEIILRYNELKISEQESNTNCVELKELFNCGEKKLSSISRECKSREKCQCALRALFNLLPSQNYNDEKNRQLFPIKPLANVLRNVILAKGDIQPLLEVVEEYHKYEDIRLSIWKGLELAAKVESGLLSPTHVKNIIDIVNLIGAQPPDSEVGPKNFFCQIKEGLLAYKGMSECTLNLWKVLSCVDLPPNLKQTLLVTLLEHLLPRMKSPIFLTDYFMAALDEGGAISLLALQGIYVLVQKFNITYPDVYTKLYSLVQPDIFSTPYKSRFYYLLDIFLSSTHLPEALVGGFAKKFARLSLLAPSVDKCILLSMICNLLIRHRGLMKLVNNIDGDQVEHDPYDSDEADPSLSRAMESSLWEVKLLQDHVLPSVSSGAMFINNPLPNVEIDLGPLLDAHFSEVFHKELKKKTKNPPLCFEKPTSLLVPRMETGLSFWTLLVSE